MKKKATDKEKRKRILKAIKKARRITEMLQRARQVNPETLLKPMDF